MDRFLPWDNLGTDVTGFTSIGEALKEAKLDWKVEAKPVFYETSTNPKNAVKNKVAIIKQDDQSFLSEIKANKPIIQNEEAFEFIDPLLKKTGGSLERVGFRDNATHCIIKLPEEIIVDDGVVPYLIARNDFNGDSKPLTVFLAPYRLACSNQLMAAMAKTNSIFKTAAAVKDTVQVDTLLTTMLGVKEKKMEHLEIEANKMVNTKVSEGDFDKIVSNLYPTSEEIGLAKRRIESNNYYRDALYEAYNKDDLANFRGTAWGVFNAFSDAITHSPTFTEAQANLEVLPSNRMKDVHTQVNALTAVRYILSQNYGLKLKY